MEKIKETIKDLLVKMDVVFEDVLISENGENNFRFVIQTKESGILIGKDGNNIKALNHLVKQIIWKKDNDFSKKKIFFVDINDYQFQNMEKIKKEAIDAAEKAVSFKRDVEMSPMSSFERMVVHSSLADNPKIVTESCGEGAFRKVVIKYKF